MNKWEKEAPPYSRIPINLYRRKYGVRKSLLCSYFGNNWYSKNHQCILKLVGEVLMRKNIYIVSKYLLEIIA